MFYSAADSDLPWAVPAMPLFSGSGNNQGSFCVPDVGTYVWVSSATSILNNGLFYVANSTSTSVTLQNPNGVVQASTPGIIQPAVTWAPIPDKYNFLYNRGMLAHLHGMYDMQSYLTELQLFIRELVGCSEGLSDTAKAIFLEDRLSQIRTAAASQAGNTATPKRAQ